MSDITWFGHSAFKISTPDARVIIDPFFAPSAGVTAEDAGDVDIVLVTRESPLSVIHLRNMLTLREAGAVVMPFSPCFYLRPSDIDAMLEQFCGRILDQVGLKHDLARWTGQEGFTT